MSKDEILMTDAALNDIDLSQDDDTGLTLDDFEAGNFVGNPQKDQTIIFTVLKVKNNPNVEVTKKDGSTFINGCTYKDPTKHKGLKGLRYDIESDLGVYTVKPWEIFFKLFRQKKGEEGVLVKYAQAHNKRFEGAKLSIKRLVDTGHANYKVEDLAKILGKSEADTKKYKEEILKARDESRCFEVTLIE